MATASAADPRRPTALLRRRAGERRGVDQRILEQSNTDGLGGEGACDDRCVLAEGEIAGDVDDDGASGDGAAEGDAGEDVDTTRAGNVDIGVEIEAGVESAEVVEGADSVQIFASEGWRAGRGRRRGGRWRRRGVILAVEIEIDD